MTYERLAYDDQDSTGQMHVDCTACAARMGLPDRRISLDDVQQAPSIDFADFPREIRKPEITVDDATALLASQLHLHLD
jgi:hypothetical protein